MRIKKEIEDIRRDSTSGVNVEQDPAEPKHLTGTIRGPHDTPYDKGVFTVDILIPADYPFSPPKMKFTTKIWHPNISSVTGAICLDILKDQWSPALTMKTALLSLQVLLCAAEPNDPQDAEVATMFKGDHERFKAVAAFWTESYAIPTRGPDFPVNPAVRRLIDMGFEEVAIREALCRTRLNEDAAVESLLAAMG